MLDEGSLSPNRTADGSAGILSASLACECGAIALFSAHSELSVFPIMAARVAHSGRVCRNQWA